MGAPRGRPYTNVLVPGMMAMMGMNIAMAVGTGINEDFRKGVMDRFRSMPIARSSVLIAKIVVEIGRMLVAITVLLIVGFLRRLRPHRQLGRPAGRRRAARRCSAPRWCGSSCCWG